MPRFMAGLLAAVAVAMAALVSFTHGDLVAATISAAATASGLGAYLALPNGKKIGGVMHVH